jgi:hypothetical protein
MALGYVTPLRTARATAVNTAIGTSGKLRVFSGTKPATGGAETTLLASLPLSATAGTITNGVLTFNPITSATAVASGTPTWARFTTSADAAVVDMVAGVGSGDLNFNAAIVSGGTVACSSAVITDGTP